MLSDVGGLAFVAISFTVNYLIRPNRPNEEKLTSYECGEDPSGTAWGRFNIRFYVVALIFVLFDVELVFLFPWATIFGNKTLIAETSGKWGWFALAEMGVFVGLLALGLAFAWAKGYLEWVKPNPKPSKFVSPVPKEMYEEVNKRYS
jgi:NADH-quinone oxidoreductase subunit A